MDRNTLDAQIRDALGAHGMWKLKLKQAVMTGVLPKPASEIGRDNGCAFGKWLQEVRSDRAVAASPQYAAVVKAHADFHREAGRIAAIVEKGDTARAGAELDGPAYNACSEILGRVMGEWRNSV